VTAPLHRIAGLLPDHGHVLFLVVGGREEQCIVEALSMFTTSQRASSFPLASRSTPLIGNPPSLNSSRIHPGNNEAPPACALIIPNMAAFPIPLAIQSSPVLPSDLSFV
jgi:hypothetical protein